MCKSGTRFIGKLEHGYHNYRKKVGNTKKRKRRVPDETETAELDDDDTEKYFTGM